MFPPVGKQHDGLFGYNQNYIFVNMSVSRNMCVICLRSLTREHMTEGQTEGHTERRGLCNQHKKLSQSLKMKKEVE